MRTTLQLDDELVKAAKKRAAEEGRTLTSIIEAALRLFLRGSSRRTTPFKLRLLMKKGRTLPGINLADRDALYERLDGRE